MSTMTRKDFSDLVVELAYFVSLGDFDHVLKKWIETEHITDIDEFAQFVKDEMAMVETGNLLEEADKLEARADALRATAQLKRETASRCL